MMFANTSLSAHKAKRLQESLSFEILLHELLSKIMLCFQKIMLLTQKLQVIKGASTSQCKREDMVYLKVVP